MLFSRTYTYFSKLKYKSNKITLNKLYLKMIRKSLLVFSLLFSFSLAQYTTFQWSLCHNATQRPTISLYDVDTYPTVKF